MRSLLKIPVFLFFVIISCVISTKKVSAQSDVNFQVFYDQLSPYGEWVEYPNYGYVWLPDAGPDFVPYSTDGHWILTDYGWTWMSDYSWGWAPFHYGRWDYDQYYGWLWIPGNEWGPAWVSWRRADGYYGWAPMEPGITLSASFGRAYDSHNDHWIFVKDRDIDRADINHYYINRTEKTRIIMHSSVINNSYNDKQRHATYAAGPARADFQKVSGRKVSPVAIQEYNKPGQSLSKGHLEIYRPVVVNNNSRGQKPVPSRIVNLKDVKQASQRTAGEPQKTNAPLPQRKVNNIKAQPKVTAPSQNIKTESQPANNKSHQSVVQDKNTRREPVKPATQKVLNNTPPQNEKKVQQPANVKPAGSDTPQNVKRESQPNNIKPENTNSSRTNSRGAKPNRESSSKDNKDQPKRDDNSQDIKKKNQN